MKKHLNLKIFTISFLRIIGFIKRKSRYWLETDWPELIKSPMNFIRLCCVERSENSVLIVEPNQFHFECLPGHIFLLKKLGYKVKVLGRRSLGRSEVFSRMPQGEIVDTVELSPLWTKWFLLCKRTAKFNWVYLASSGLVENHGFYGFYLDYLGREVRGRSGYVMIEHNIRGLEDFLKYGKIDLNRVAMLREFQLNGTKIPMINPHYFGQVSRKRKGNFTRFIIVGGFATKARDPRILLNAVSELNKRGVSNFEVIIVGEMKTRIDHLNLPEQIKVKGRVGFDALYKELESADYIIPLLDVNNKTHKRFLDGETTGTYQLILGFLKVPIMQKEFSASYLFSPESAIIYDNNSLDAAMEQAINLSPDKYSNYSKNIETISERVRDVSLSNLRKILS